MSAGSGTAQIYAHFSNHNAHNARNARNTSYVNETLNLLWP